MDNIAIPVDDAFVESVAKAIARDRLYRQANAEIQEISGGLGIQDIGHLERYFEDMFAVLWSSDLEGDEMQRNSYRADARAAIDSINLKLLLAE